MTDNIPMSKTHTSLRNFLSTRPPNTMTIDVPTLTAVWALKSAIGKRMLFTDPKII